MIGPAPVLALKQELSAKLPVGVAGHCAASLLSSHVASVANPAPRCDFPTLYERRSVKPKGTGRLFGIGVPP